MAIRDQERVVKPDADIALTAYGSRWLDKQFSVVLHKPAGVVSTQAEDDQQPAWQLLIAQSVPYLAIDPQLVSAITEKPWQLHRRWSS